MIVIERLYFFDNSLKAANVELISNVNTQFEIIHNLYECIHQHHIRQLGRVAKKVMDHVTGKITPSILLTA
jgi:hypothetical protein